MADQHGKDALWNELKAREAVAKGVKTDTVLDSGLAIHDSHSLAKMLRLDQKVIYGEDDRVEVEECADPKIKKVADSVAALFLASDIVSNGDGTSQLQVQVFGTARNLCGAEAFRTQPVGAFCSGVLVAPDIIATAGHCINQSNVNTVRFVFGFRMIAGSAILKISNDNIYSGKEIIAWKEASDGADFALVRLDRAVSSRLPVSIRRVGKIANDAALHVIGHPSGLPMKVAGNAVVKDNSKPDHFVANLDTYGGNSGSPVFNSETHEVEGLLVRGETDFVNTGTCSISLVCPTTGCRGEDCTRAILLAPFLAAVPPGGGGPPPPVPVNGYQNLSQQAGAAVAAGEPVVYERTSDKSQHIVYRGVDGNIHDIQLD